MGFNKNGYSLINDENKIRLSLSKKACLIMAEDMSVFNINQKSSYINTIFKNYSLIAKSSVSLYLENRRNQLESILNVDDFDKIVDLLLQSEVEGIHIKIKEYLTSKESSHVYHISNENKEFITNICNEESFYHKPSDYIKAVIEEYSELPFIKREEIFRSDIYEVINQACRERRVLKIKTVINNIDETLTVYPYKIISGNMNTQSYLACYTTRKGTNTKRIASFSMARINKPTMLRQTFKLTKEEVKSIEEKLSKTPASYLIEDTEIIKVRLTKRGMQSYKTRLFARPDKIDALSTNEILAFECSQNHAYNYFFPFGSEVEIISPISLRNRFIDTHTKSLEVYSK